MAREFTQWGRTNQQSEAVRALFVREPGGVERLILTGCRRGRQLSRSQCEAVMLLQARVRAAAGLPPVCWVTEQDSGLDVAPIGRVDEAWLARKWHDHPSVRA